MIDWTDAATIGYQALVLGVLVGSIVPVVPTGAVVGIAAAVAMTAGRLSLPAVIVLAAAAALAGDLVTFGVARVGSAAAVRLLVRGHAPGQLAEMRERFRAHGARLVVVGRIVPAGRIPVLVAAGALDYPWGRLVPAAALGCVLWAVAYAALGVVSGGLFPDPLVATLIATGLALVVAAVTTLVGRRRRARR